MTKTSKTSRPCATPSTTSSPRSRRAAELAVDGLDPALLGERLRYTFDDPRLARQAMTHRSWCAEVAGAESNERLEFLGDAVLGWLVADMAYRAHPDLPEGRLTDLRKNVVNAHALAEIARGLGLGEFLLLGRGEHADGGRDKPSILSDAFEAVLGAVYLDGGRDGAAALIERLLGARIRASEARLGMLDYKTLLQELAARGGHGAPAYRVEHWGPEHAKRFRATVTIDGRPLGEGEGNSKKQAEQTAARVASEAVQGGPLDADAVAALKG